MTTTIEEAVAPATSEQPQGAVVGASDFRTAVQAIDTFASDVDRAFEREHPDDSVLVGFYGTHIVLDGGDNAAYVAAQVQCEGKPFDHEEILVDRHDLRAVAKFVGTAAGNMAVTVTIVPAGDGYLSFRVGEHGFEAVVPFEPAEVPYVPRRGRALLVTGAALAAASYLAIRAFTSRRVRS